MAHLLRKIATHKEAYTIGGVQPSEYSEKRCITVSRASDFNVTVNHSDEPLRLATVEGMAIAAVGKRIILEGNLCENSNTWGFNKTNITYRVVDENGAPTTLDGEYQVNWKFQNKNNDSGFGCDFCTNVITGSSGTLTYDNSTSSQLLSGVIITKKYKTVLYTKTANATETVAVQDNTYDNRKQNQILLSLGGNWIDEDNYVSSSDLKLSGHSSILGTVIVKATINGTVYTSNEIRAKGTINIDFPTQIDALAQGFSLTNVRIIYNKAFTNDPRESVATFIGATTYRYDLPLLIYGKHTIDEGKEVEGSSSISFHNGSIVNSNNFTIKKNVNHTFLFLPLREVTKSGGRLTSGYFGANLNYASLSAYTKYNDDYNVNITFDPMLFKVGLTQVVTTKLNNMESGTLLDNEFSPGILMGKHLTYNPDNVQLQVNDKSYDKSNFVMVDDDGKIVAGQTNKYILAIDISSSVSFDEKDANIVTLNSREIDVVGYTTYNKAPTSNNFNPKNFSWGAGPNTTMLNKYKVVCEYTKTGSSEVFTTESQSTLGPFSTGTGGTGGGGMWYEPSQPLDINIEDVGTIEYKFVKVEGNAKEEIHFDYTINRKPWINVNYIANHYEDTVEKIGYYKDLDINFALTPKSKPQITPTLTSGSSSTIIGSVGKRNENATINLESTLGLGYEGRINVVSSGVPEGYRVYETYTDDPVVVNVDIKTSGYVGMNLPLTAQTDKPVSGASLIAGVTSTTSFSLDGQYKDSIFLKSWLYPETELEKLNYNLTTLKNSFKVSPNPYRGGNVEFVIKTSGTWPTEKPVKDWGVMELYINPAKITFYGSEANPNSFYASIPVSAIYPANSEFKTLFETYRGSNYLQLSGQNHFNPGDGASDVQFYAKDLNISSGKWISRNSGSTTNVNTSWSLNHNGDYLDAGTGKTFTITSIFKQSNQYGTSSTFKFGTEGTAKVKLSLKPTSDGGAKDDTPTYYDIEFVNKGQYGDNIGWQISSSSISGKALITPSGFPDNMKLSIDSLPIKQNGQYIGTVAGSFNWSATSNTLICNSPTYNFISSNWKEGECQIAKDSNLFPSVAVLAPGYLFQVKQNNT